MGRKRTKPTLDSLLSQQQYEDFMENGYTAVAYDGGIALVVPHPLDFGEVAAYMLERIDAAGLGALLLQLSDLVDTTKS